MAEQDRNSRQIKPWEHGLALITIVLIAILAACFSSCTRHIYYYVYQRDTTYIAKEKIDSIFQKDSVFIKDKGDTLYIYKEKIRDRYHYIHDTTYKVRVDSVIIEREKIKEVEKPLSKWKSAQIGAFWYLLGGLVLSLVLLFRKPIWKLLKLVIK